MSRFFECYFANLSQLFLDTQQLINTNNDTSNNDNNWDNNSIKENKKLECKLSHRLISASLRRNATSEVAIVALYPQTPENIETKKGSRKKVAMVVSCSLEAALESFKACFGIRFELAYVPVAMFSFFGH